MRSWALDAPSCRSARLGRTARRVRMRALLDLTLSPNEQSFRDELRTWLADNHPGEPPSGDEAGFDFAKAWQRKLHEAGYAGLSWPKEYGGRGATLIEQAIFGEEMARAKAPSTANVLGLVMGGPVVIAHGTDEQKQRYLEPILSAEEIWCQGFSEPESGSDLASLKTQGGEVERGMGRDRPEGLDHARPRGQVVHARRAHGPRRSQAQGPHLLPDGHGAGRGPGAPAAPDHRRGRVQRAVHRGGADPRRERRRRRGERVDRWPSPP